MKDTDISAEIVIQTRHWDELIKELGPNVGFFRRTEEGALYAPIQKGGLVDSNPSKLGLYVVS